MTTRDYVEYEVPGSTEPVKVHKVTSNTEGTVQTVGGWVDVREGDVLIKSQNEAYVDVYTTDQFDELGYTASRDQRDLASEVDGDSSGSTVNDDDFFEPDEHNARDVHAYLSRSDVSDENKRRVIESERNSRNRTSAIPADMR